MITEAQVIKCRGCGITYAAHVAPNCHSDKDWKRELREAVRRGDSIQMEDIESVRHGEFGCKCKRKEAKQ